MPSKSTILLPRLKGFRLHRFVPMFSEDLSMVIEERSPNIILVGNGLGKTTIMQSVVYGLTGGASEKIEPEKTFRWDHRYFRGRLNPDDLREATVTVDFSLGRVAFSIVRGFNHNGIIEFKQSGRKRPIEEYPQALTQVGGYVSVDDFSFIVHRLLYLPESRRLVAWDTDAQVRLLMLLNQDAASEETFREHRKNLKLMDSKKRHTHVAIGKADEQLASLMQYEDEASAEPDEEEESQTPEFDTAAIAQQLQDIYKTRLELERDLHNQEAALTMTSSDVESLRRRIDSAEALIVNNILTEEERNSSLALNRLLKAPRAPHAEHANSPSKKSRGATRDWHNAFCVVPSHHSKSSNCFRPSDPKWLKSSTRNELQKDGSGLLGRSSTRHNVVNGTCALSIIPPSHRSRSSLCLNKISPPGRGATCLH